MLIKAHELTDDFLTSSGGLVIGKQIANHIKENPFEEIVVSFEGVESVTPSFINGVFLYVIDLYGEAIFRERVRVVKSTEQVAFQIKNSVKKYIDHRLRFFEELQVFSVYLFSDLPEEGRAHLDELERLLKARNISPKRVIENQSPGQGDVLIAVVSGDGDSIQLQNELIKARKNKVKTVLLVHEKIPGRLRSKNLKGTQVIYFNQNNLIEQSVDLSSKISTVKINAEKLNDFKILPLVTARDRRNSANVIGGSALIGLALLGLSAALFSSDDKD